MPLQDPRWKHANLLSSAVDSLGRLRESFKVARDIDAQAQESGTLFITKASGDSKLRTDHDNDGAVHDFMDDQISPKQPRPPPERRVSTTGRSLRSMQSGLQRVNLADYASSRSSRRAEEDAAQQSRFQSDPQIGVASGTSIGPGSKQHESEPAPGATADSAGDLDSPWLFNIDLDKLVQHTSSHAMDDAPSPSFRSRLSRNGSSMAADISLGSPLSTPRSRLKEAAMQQPLSGSPAVAARQRRMVLAVSVPDGGSSGPESECESPSQLCSPQPPSLQPPEAVSPAAERRPQASLRRSMIGREALQLSQAAASSSPMSADSPRLSPRALASPAVQRVLAGDALLRRRTSSPGGYPSMAAADSEPNSPLGVSAARSASPMQRALDSDRQLKRSSSSGASPPAFGLATYQAQVQREAEAARIKEQREAGLIRNSSRRPGGLALPYDKMSALLDLDPATAELKQQQLGATKRRQSWSGTAQPAPPGVFDNTSQMRECGIYYSSREGSFKVRDRLLWRGQDGVYRIQN